MAQLILRLIIEILNMNKIRRVFLLLVMQAVRISPLLAGLYKQNESTSAMHFFNKKVDDGKPVHGYYKYDRFKNIVDCIELAIDPLNNPLAKCNKYPWKENHDPVCFEILENCNNIISNAEKMSGAEGGLPIPVPPLAEMHIKVLKCNMSGNGRDECDDGFKKYADEFIEKKIKNAQGFKKGSYRDDYLAGLSISFIMSIFFDNRNIDSYEGLKKAALPILGASIFSLLLALMMPYQPRETEDGYLGAYLRESPDIFPVLSREAIKSILDCAERANEEAKACFKISFAASINGCVYFAICRIRDCVQRSRARGDEHSEDGGGVEMWNVSATRGPGPVMGLPPLTQPRAPNNLSGPLTLARPSAPNNPFRGVVVGPLRQSQSRGWL